MKTLTLTFTEVEHQGDLNNIIRDIESCGGRVLNSRCDGGSDGVFETGTVTFEVADSIEFTAKFKLTDSWDFRI